MIYNDTDSMVVEAIETLTLLQKEEIEDLWREYAEECEVIADMCEAEGYPRYGSNYELRCSNARAYYTEVEDYIMNGRKK